MFTLSSFYQHALFSVFSQQNNGPYWLVDERGNPTTVTDQQYVELLVRKKWPGLQNWRNLRQVWFLQDGALAHAFCLDLSWIFRGEK